MLAKTYLQYKLTESEAKKKCDWCLVSLGQGIACVLIQTCPDPHSVPSLTRDGDCSSELAGVLNVLLMTDKHTHTLFSYLKQAKIAKESSDTSTGIGDRGWWPPFNNGTILCSSTPATNNSTQQLIHEFGEMHAMGTREDHV